MVIVVIIPTYNEAENIGQLLDILLAEEFPKFKGHEMMVLVIDDNSPDGTASVVKKMMKKYKSIKLLSGEKRGLGAAVVHGMKHAMKEMSADAVIEMDGDLQHNPKDVRRLIAALDEGYDYVIGSRYIAEGSIPSEWAFYRRFLSRAGNLFTRVALHIFSIHDITSGFKLTRVKEVLDKVNLDGLLSTSYAYKIHLLYEIVRQGARVKEIPIKFRYRKNGSSKIEREDIRESLRVVTLLALRRT